MLDPIILIKTIGLLGIFLAVFLESGIPFGFFLPGDSLLFSAGLLASQGFLPFPLLVIGCIICAIAGDSVGYFLGKKMGRRLFEKEVGLIFRKKYITQAEDFYTKHGKYTILIARFIPIIRTFAPIVAGIGHMNYKTFISYNIFGGIIWSAGLLTLGYFLGTIIPNIDTYILPILIGIIFISFIPVIVKIYVERRRK